MFTLRQHLLDLHWRLWASHLTVNLLLNANLCHLLVCSLSLARHDHLARNAYLGVLVLPRNWRLMLFSNLIYCVHHDQLSPSWLPKKLDCISNCFREILHLMPRHYPEDWITMNFAKVATTDPQRSWKYYNLLDFFSFNWRFADCLKDSTKPTTSPTSFDSTLAR